MSASGYGSGPVPPGVGMGPEALNPRTAFVYASYGARAGAAVVDFLVKAIFAVLVLVAVGSLAGVGFLAGDETSGFVAVVVAVLMGFFAFAVASLLYEPIYMSVTDGQTLGKQVTGCRVVRADGQRMDFAWALLREVVVKWLAIGVVGTAITAGMPLATLLDNLWPLWDDQKRALHDMVVDTRVIVA